MNNLKAKDLLWSYLGFYPTLIYFLFLVVHSVIFKSYKRSTIICLTIVVLLVSLLVMVYLCKKRDYGSRTENIFKNGKRTNRILALYLVLFLLKVFFNILPIFILEIVSLVLLMTLVINICFSSANVSSIWSWPLLIVLVVASYIPNQLFSIVVVYGLFPIIELISDEYEKGTLDKYIICKIQPLRLACFQPKKAKAAVSIVFMLWCICRLLSIDLDKFKFFNQFKEVGLDKIVSFSLAVAIVGVVLFIFALVFYIYCGKIEQENNFK